ncbi:MAG: hypothetical protein ACRCS5_04660 [Sphingomonas sp.]|uniref:hypothetical protein n=1 Tax=Sphingomonas sp. TaxID=28214 RepID=UPI0030FA9F1E
MLHIVQFADAVDPAPVQAMLVDLHAARAGDDGRVWFDGAILSSEWKDAMGGQVRHGDATITHAIRAIQGSQASLATLSRELGDQS